jgi:hypothetical protein
MKSAQKRGKMQARQRVPIAFLGMLAICCLSLAGCTPGEAAQQTARPDLVEIAALTSLTHLERPSVIFPHDLHTDAMREREEDCKSCHQVDADGKQSPRYERLEELSDDDLTDLYHDNCIACHQERADAREKGGPVACGDCHQRWPSYASSRQLFGMNKSLHYRHVKATKEKCETCHHIYDETKKELVYAENEASSCRDCHREQQEENRSPLRAAVHEACIGCHLDPPQELKADAVGPDSCAGCHDLEQQLAIAEAKEKPPRLKLDQPDFILLSATTAELEASKLRTVPFSHVDHEQVTDSCRVCHHETLDPCGKCHTLKGSEEANGITLYRAMHSMTAEPSCIGCHEAKKTESSCAGCHDQMEQGRPSDLGCDICHAGPLPQKLETERSLYASMDDFRPKNYEMDLASIPFEIPEKVTISILTNEYKAAEMPHAQIVKELKQRISDSNSAVYFHGREDVVCQGCHHASPAGEAPPLCENCHGTESAERDLLKPGLRGAYHQQCVGCHDSMKLKKPSDCSGCHEEGQAAMGTLASSRVR